LMKLGTILFLPSWAKNRDYSVIIPFVFAKPTDDTDTIELNGEKAH